PPRSRAGAPRPSGSRDPPTAAGGLGALVGGVRLLGRFSKARQGSLLPLTPGAVEGAGVPAHGAVAVAMDGMERERELEELRRVAGAGGGRAHGGGEGPRGAPHLGHRIRYASRVGWLQARDRP